MKIQNQYKTNLDLLSFFGMTFLISWGIWILLINTESQSQIGFWVAGFGPTLSATTLHLLNKTWRNLGNLFRYPWHIQAHWYLISIFGTPMVMLVALGFHIGMGGSLPRYIDTNHMVTSLEQWPLILIVYGYIFIFTALGEEIGWRGYALPRMLNRFSPFITSILLGIIWACWHLPLFWISGDFHQQLPISWFILQILGSTFIYTWIFKHTKEKLWPALLFHTSSNAAVGLLPILPLDNSNSLRPLWLVVIFLWIAVGVLLWFERKSFFLQPTSLSPLNKNVPNSKSVDILNTEHYKEKTENENKI